MWVGYLDFRDDVAGRHLRLLRMNYLGAENAKNADRNANQHGQHSLEFVFMGSIFFMAASLLGCHS
jgi:hypothetical protein